MHTVWETTPPPLLPYLGGIQASKPLDSKQLLHKLYIMYIVNVAQLAGLCLIQYLCMTDVKTDVKTIIIYMYCEHMPGNYRVHELWVLGIYM